MKKHPILDIQWTFCVFSLGEKVRRALLFFFFFSFFFPAQDALDPLFARGPGPPVLMDSQQEKKETIQMNEEKKDVFSSKPKSSQGRGTSRGRGGRRNHKEPKETRTQEETEELILKQIEYYFSRDNLCKDLYLRSHMKEEGWVQISLLAGFNRVKMLSTSTFVILKSLEKSELIEMDGENIRLKEGWKYWLLPENTHVPPKVRKSYAPSPSSSPAPSPAPSPLLSPAQFGGDSDRETSESECSDSESSRRRRSRNRSRSRSRKKKADEALDFPNSAQDDDEGWEIVGRKNRSNQSQSRSYGASDFGSGFAKGGFGEMGLNGGFGGRGSSSSSSSARKENPDTELPFDFDDDDPMFSEEKKDREESTSVKRSLSEAPEEDDLGDDDINQIILVVDEQGRKTRFDFFFFFFFVQMSKTKQKIYCNKTKQDKNYDTTQNQKTKN